MEWWQSVYLPIPNLYLYQNQTKLIRIIFTPANHYSARGLFDAYDVLWGSWTVIGPNGHRFWFGGDTGYSDVFKQIGKKYGPIDLAAIPIGMLYIRREITTYISM